MNDQIITRQDAKAQGLKRYFTGGPCKRGHVAERLVSNGKCVECRREWREANRDKVREQKRESYRKRCQDPEYCERRRERIRKRYAEDPGFREKTREYQRKRLEDPEFRERERERRREYMRKRREDPEHRDKIAEQRRKRREDPKVRERECEREREYQRKRYAEDPEFREALKERNRKWSRENPDKIAAKGAKRHAAKLQRTPGFGCQCLISLFYEAAREATEKTGVEHHVDHVIPLQGRAVSGLHVASNLQILSAAENVSKGNSYAAD